MPTRLDALLLPGETVQFRASGRALGGSVFIWTTLFFGYGIFNTVVYSVSPIPDSSIWDLMTYTLPVIGAFCVCWAGIVLIQARQQRRSPDVLLITDTRLLYAKGSWTRKYDSITLDKIERLDRGDVTARSELIVYSTGKVLILPKFKNQRRLVERAAAAAGVPAPADIGRLETIDLTVLAGFLIMALAYSTIWLTLEWFGLSMTSHPPSPGFVLVLSLVKISVLALGVLLAPLIGQLLTTTIMRPFVTPEQMSAWLCDQQPSDRRRRLTLAWASILYGQNMPGSTS